MERSASGHKARGSSCRAAWALVLLLGCAPDPLAPFPDGETPAARDDVTQLPTQLVGVSNGSVAHVRGWKWHDLMSNMQTLRDAGFTAILISPHTSTCGGDFSDGYDPYDYRNFNSRFGSEGDLWWLVQTAHHYGVRIYADMVMNHLCAKSDYNYPRFGWNDFHHEGHVKYWEDSNNVLNGDLFGLQDLAHESPYVRGELWNFLVQTNNYGFDGYRLDAAKHVPLWYWRDHVTPALNGWGKLVFGEVYDAKLDLLQSYSDAGMHVTDYNLYDALFNAFKFGGDLTRLDGAGFAARNGSRAMTFVENHDVGAPQNRHLALAFIAGYPGYPIFYNVNPHDQELRNLAWVHNHLAHGRYINRLKERDVFVYEREGNLLVGINQTGEWVSRWVDTSWSNTRLHDFSGHGQDLWTAGDRRFQIWIPPMSYVMYSP